MGTKEWKCECGGKVTAIWSDNESDPNLGQASFEHDPDIDCHFLREAVERNAEEYGVTVAKAPWLARS